MSENQHTKAMRRITKWARPFLNDEVRQALHLMHNEESAAEDDKQGEPMITRYGTMYVGTTRICKKVVKQLFTYCLIKQDCGNGDEEEYYVTLTEDGRKSLENPQHIPAICSAMQAQNGVERGPSGPALVQDPKAAARYDRLWPAW